MSELKTLEEIAKEELERDPSTEKIIGWFDYDVNGETKSVKLVCDFKHGIGSWTKDGWPLGQFERIYRPPVNQTKWGEPPPKEGGEIVFTEVMKDIESRAEFGLKKYGTYLKTHNGRSALKDAYEEVLDLAMYLKQKLMEEENGG